MDHLLEPKGVKLSVAFLAFSGREAVEGPLSGPGIGQGGNVGRDLGGLSRNGLRAEHRREPVIHGLY